ncbi:uncharacterized protein RJT21DRAFT_12585 [Scheffersomyces amazonensis]|uniref:uncharacterized protein n=1 Tax=Scheffersomyces amazonensis TaxID=1078765 RepID=UPI00315D3AF1
MSGSASRFQGRKRSRPGASGSTYIPSKELLELEPPTKPRVPNSIDSLRAIDYIKKLTKTKITSADKEYDLQILVSGSEAVYFEDGEIGVSELLHNQFKLSQYSVLPVNEGCIDRLIHIRGTSESLGKSGVYIAFILSAKLNTISSNAYTSSFPKYHLRCLTNSNYNSHSNSNSNSHIKVLRGDFNNLYNDIIVHIQKYGYKYESIDDSSKYMNKIYGVHIDTGINNNLEYKHQVDNAHKRAIDYIYSKN